MSWPTHIIVGELLSFSNDLPHLPSAQQEAEIVREQVHHRKGWVEGEGVSRLDERGGVHRISLTDNTHTQTKQKEREAVKTSLSKEITYV